MPEQQKKTEIASYLKNLDTGGFQNGFALGGYWAVFRS